MKNQEIKDPSTLGLLFYERMKVLQSSVVFTGEGVNIYLNYFFDLCMLALISHSFQIIDPPVIFKVFQILMISFKDRSPV